MNQISSLPSFLAFQSPGNAGVAYGDTVETAKGGEFYFQVSGAETRTVHGPIPKLGPIPTHEVFVPSTESLSAVRGTWNGIQRDINVIDIDSHQGLTAQVQRDAITKELLLAIDNASDKASHRILIPLRVDGSAMQAEQLANADLLKAIGGAPAHYVRVSVNGGYATVAVGDPNGKENLYTVSNGDTSIQSN